MNQVFLVFSWLKTPFAQWQSFMDLLLKFFTGSVVIDSFRGITMEFGVCLILAV